MPTRSPFTLSAFAAGALALAACTNTPQSDATGAATVSQAGAPSAADLQTVARSLAQAGMIKPGDRVLVGGSVRDAALLEDVAVEAMKLGGQPLITIGSDRLGRRSFDDVSATFDTLPPKLGIALANAFDVQISVDVGESNSVMAGVPAARIAARNKAGQAANQAFFKRGIRTVNLGNGLYPTASLAKRLGVSQADLASTFWRASAVPPETIRAKGDAVRTALAAGKQITVTAANGTNVTFAITAAKAVVSDGAITADKVKQASGASTITWLPAGELIAPIAMGSAEGKVVIDKINVQGTDVVGLTLTFSKGKLTAMTATSGLEVVKALYDASGGARDVLSSIDLGLNPEVKLPTNTGRIVWMGAGALTLGIGDNQSMGGPVVSDFGLALPITNATVLVDGKPVMENGALK